jgi:hypothetical protein
MNLYRFIDTEKAVYPIRLLCRVLSVPESSYFDWDGGGRDRQRQRDDARDTLIEACREVHVESGETYGAPRVHGALVRCVTAVLLAGQATRPLSPPDGHVLRHRSLTW